MPKKIFELAKELGQKPLDLVETLKGFGLNLKSHMSVLSDEEEVVARSKLVELEEEKQFKQGKKKKKKVAKKKVAKKKVAKKASKKSKTSKVKAAVSTTSDPSEKEKEIAASSNVVKRRTVIRKKRVKKEESSEVAASAEENSLTKGEDIQLAGEGSAPIGESAAMLAEQQEGVEAQPPGLRVVSRPKSPEKESTDTAVIKGAASIDNKSEKMFSFTPVYTPPKKEADKEDKTKSAEASKTVDSNAAETSASEGATKEKRRLGDLAAMVARPKSVNRTRELTQMRADEELKTYAGTSSLGKIVYTPLRKKKNYIGATKGTTVTVAKGSKRVVGIHQGTTVLELSKKLNVAFSAFADNMLDLNLLINTTDYIGLQLAREMAAVYDYRVEDTSFKEDKVLGKGVDEKEKSDLPIRNPIITIMGHVDHGKTTLLDYIRKSKVADAEAGGITQHIGAYSVEARGKILTFLDTPGHAAFSSMRKRGAEITDIVVLVVAADDGVMPQTKESVQFCKAAGVPIIVAINKIDREGSNPERAKQGLTEMGVTPEEWGGETQMVPVSALNGDGVDDLLEAIALQAEMMELKANPQGNVGGIVIESKIESGRGAVCTVLIQQGTLEKGQNVVVGETFGRARSLFDYKGSQLKSAGPSTPVQIFGLNETPKPGDDLNAVKNEREARKVIENRIRERKLLEVDPQKRAMNLEDFLSDMQQSEAVNVLKLIVRADVQGSFEAIKNSLEVLRNDEVAVSVIGGGVGAINDNDVLLASNAGAYIIGFNMRPLTSARRMAEERGVDVKNYSVIYELINDVTLALEGLLKPEYVENYIGRAEVRETFQIPKVGVIAGSAVIDGKIAFGCSIRLLRDGKIVFDGKLSTLKRFKDDVKEVKNGLECGIALDNYNDIKTNDIFEAYTLEAKMRKLDVSQEVML